MTPALNTVLYQARERTKQDTEKTHAALERVEDRGQSPRQNSTLPSVGHLMSLPDWPVVEQPTCAHDNNMHTNRPNSRRRPKKCKKSELGPPKSTLRIVGWTSDNRREGGRFSLPGLMVHPNLQSSNSRGEKEEKRALSNNEMLRIGVDHWTKPWSPRFRLSKNQVHPPSRGGGPDGPVSGDLT